jgi:predicted kinase
MKKVICYRGLPASGKDFDAKELMDKNPNKYKRVNKDDIRAMMDCGHWSEDTEQFVVKVRDSLILLALKEGKHVLVTDTNFGKKHIPHIEQLVKGLATVEIKDFSDIPIEICIERDLKRARSVGEKVIRKMYNQFLYEKTTIKYDESDSLPHCIIVDVDGTISIMGDRSPYEWSKVCVDTINHAVRSVVNSYKGGEIFIFSGRDGECHEATFQWLKDNDVKFHHLYLREAGNVEKDSIIKQRLFDEHIKGKYYVDFVLDDRLQVARLWHSLGLTLLRVGDPDADF